MTETTAQANPSFAPLLKHWRALRRVSQLDLAMTADVSQRHISFLESGRASASRHMVLQLGDALDMPLRERNRLLTAAGFAPVYESRALHDPDMAPVLAALELILSHHEPNPTLVVDRHWNIRMHNNAVTHMFALLGDMPAIWAQVCPDAPPNVLKLMFHPAGVRRFITNWHEIGPVMIGRTHRDAEIEGNDTLLALIDEILAYPGVPARWRTPDWKTTPPPVLPLEYQVDGTRLKLFSMLSTFGTAQDITADELRIETFFPADADSAGMLRSLADSASAN